MANIAILFICTTRNRRSAATSAGVEAEEVGASIALASALGWQRGIVDLFGSFVLCACG